MDIDSRDTLWKEAHELRFYTGYAEHIEHSLSLRWSWLDSISKIAVAATSTGSALACLALWRDPHFAFLWPMLTTISALLAIISKHLEVADKIRNHTACAIELNALSVDIGTLIVRMKVNPDFSVADYEKKLIALRERYKGEARKFSRDILLTKRLAFRTAKDCAIGAPPIELASIPERNCHEIQ
jgi:hypothetical protein